MLDLVRRSSSLVRIVLVILYFGNLWNDHSWIVERDDEYVVDTTIPTIVSVKLDGSATVVDDIHPTISENAAATKHPLALVKLERDKEPDPNKDTRTKNSSVTNATTITCTRLGGGNGATWSVPIFPHLIIVGAAKAGTTALSHFLNQVPNVLRTTPGEPHFWDGFVHGNSPRQWSSHGQRCKLLQQYHSFWPLDQIGPDTITFEKTPSLLAMSNKPGVIRALLDPHPPKILIVLRNPVDRFYSNYKMNFHRNRGMVSRSMAKNIQWEVAQLKNRSVLDVPLLSNTTDVWNASDFVALPKSSSPEFDWRWSMVARGFYAPQIERYMRFFPLGTSLKVVHYENFTQNKVDTLNEIMEWLGLPPYYNWTDNELEQHYGPGQKATKVRPMPTKIKKYLEHLYKPFNEKLATLLGEEWRGVWQYENL